MRTRDLVVLAVIAFGAVTFGIVLHDYMEQQRAQVAAEALRTQLEVARRHALDEGAHDWINHMNKQLGIK